VDPGPGGAPSFSAKALSWRLDRGGSALDLAQSIEMHAAAAKAQAAKAAAEL
jgi:hypothetical protein